MPSYPVIPFPQERDAAENGWHRRKVLALGEPMADDISKVPVLFIIFNRPDTTAQVFEAIRRARPPRLYVAADGPRAGREGEIEKCALTRQITESVDWPCEVRRLYRDENLGCGKAVSSAITWYFENEEEGIILEDDCVPDPSFFPYCGAMLERYRNDDRVMMVAGSDYSLRPRVKGPSYYFATYFPIWGWATWRRAWNNYDFRMAAWPEFKRRKGVRKVVRDTTMARWLEDCFEQTYRGGIDTRDYQWAFTGLLGGKLSVCPNGNLISNIGYVGAHMKGDGPDSVLMNLPRHRFDIDNMVHPAKVSTDRAADRAIYRAVMKDVNPRGIISVADRFVWRVWLKVRGEKGPLHKPA